MNTTRPAAAEPQARKDEARWNGLRPRARADARIAYATAADASPTGRPRQDRPCEGFERRRGAGTSSASVASWRKYCKRMAYRMPAAVTRMKSAAAIKDGVSCWPSSARVCQRGSSIGTASSANSTESAAGSARATLGFVPAEPRRVSSIQCHPVDVRHAGSCSRSRSLRQLRRLTVAAPMSYGRSRPAGSANGTSRACPRSRRRQALDIAPRGCVAAASAAGAATESRDRSWRRSKPCRHGGRRPGRQSMRRPPRIRRCGRSAIRRPKVADTPPISGEIVSRKSSGAVRR